MVDVAGDQAWSDKRKGAFQLNMGTHFTSLRNLAFTGEVSKLFGHEHGYQGSISAVKDGIFALKQDTMFF